MSNEDWNAKHTYDPNTRAGRRIAANQQRLAQHEAGKSGSKWLPEVLAVLAFIVAVGLIALMLKAAVG